MIFSWTRLSSAFFPAIRRRRASHSDWVIGSPFTVATTGPDACGANEEGAAACVAGGRVATRVAAAPVLLAERAGDGAAVQTAPARVAAAHSGTKRRIA